MLSAYEQWGIEDATRRFVGMFAMAVWDQAERTLHLVRDRLGIKPLYVWQGDGQLAFASELKSLMALPQFDRALDHDAVAAYLRFLYVPAPHSVFRRVRKLEPFHFSPRYEGEEQRMLDEVFASFAGTGQLEESGVRATEPGNAKKAGVLL